MDQVSVELINRCQQDSPGAYDDLFALIQEDLYRWIYSLMRNPDDTDEVFQECCVRIYRNLPKLQDASKFAAWVSRIVINQCNTFRSRAGRLRSYAFDEALETQEDAMVASPARGPSPREAAYKREVFNEVNCAIQQLPPRQRTAVLLFDVEGFSIREIAETLECSEGAVKFNIHQGRRKLRELLAHHVESSGERMVIE